MGSLNPRELRRHLESLRDLRPMWDDVWIRDTHASPVNWYPVKFWGMGQEPGEVEVDDVLTVVPRKSKVMRAEEVRLSNPDEDVRLRRPVRITKRSETRG